MDKKEIEQKVKEILADRLDIDIKKIRPDSDLVDDLGMDSFRAVELAFAVREEFGIEIPTKDMADMRTVRDLMKYIEKKGGG
ncbi:MAG: acyl carrier protein [Candidatus Omnitrophica bacterium]|nr:acyl carrier protein [Candidatus Omnitrophota bacterium]